MKKTILFLFFGFMSFCIGNTYSYAVTDTAEVIFQDDSAENLPYSSSGQNIDETETEINNRENPAEIKLTHSPCRRRHGEKQARCGAEYQEIHSPHHHGRADHHRPRRHGHKRRHGGHHHHHSPPAVIVPPLVITPPYSNVCRKNIFYCVTPYSAGPVGSSCICYDLFGNIWFTGYRSSW